MVLTLIDLSASFDTVNSRILYSFSDMGIICSALSLCESFFSGDTFRVSWPFGLSPALHWDVRRISAGTAALCHISDPAGANEKHGKDDKLSMEGMSWASESRCC